MDMEADIVYDGQRASRQYTCPHCGYCVSRKINSDEMLLDDPEALTDEELDDDDLDDDDMEDDMDDWEN
jgi:aerobic-type carbon monoxide dehydrogenase small subunit (CoxS/CutS family)